MRMKGKERPSAWDGDWKVRVCQRINELGYGTYLDYLQARRGVSYDALAAELSRERWNTIEGRKGSKVRR